MLAVGALASTGLAQLRNPTDWTWRLDADAKLVTSLDPPAGSWLFGMMPPGWHVTTGPGALLTPSKLAAQDGNFSVEAEIFLFPGDSQEGLGIFIGGQDAAYTALLIRRDGQAAAFLHTGTDVKAVAPWQRHEGITPGNAAQPVKNVLKVDVDPASVSLSVNGGRVAQVPRQSVRTEGRVGLRIGKGLNLHITTFDVTQRLAPQRAR